jgi:hypothetical protein
MGVGWIYEAQGIIINLSSINMNFLLEVTVLSDASWLHSLYIYLYVIVWDGPEISAKPQVIINGLILSEKYISVGYNFNYLLCSHV